MESVWVTGANGQLGTALRKISERFDGFEFHFTDVEALNICDKPQVESFVKANGIDVIVNCAAYTAVDKAEDDADLCMRTNRDAVRQPPSSSSPPWRRSLAPRVL